MGIMDRFKKEKKDEKPTAKPTYNCRSTVSEYTSSAGRPFTKFEIIDDKEYFSRNGKYKGYDSIVLSVNKRPINIDGQELYRATVEWNEAGDTMYLDSKGDDDRAEILLGLNFDLLKNDSEYEKCLMTSLLDKNRVKQIDETMKDKRGDLAGNYIGGVIGANGEYIKYFNKGIGKQVYNSPNMVRKREKRAKDKADMEDIIRRETEEKIKSKQDEIEALQKRLNPDKGNRPSGDDEGR